DDYRLVYTTLEGEVIELFDEQQIFHTISYVRQMQSSGGKIRFQVVTRHKSLPKQAQIVNKKIGNLIGFGLYRFDYLKDMEVDIFRRNMVRVRQEAVEMCDEFVYS